MAAASNEIKMASPATEAARSAGSFNFYRFQPEVTEMSIGVTGTIARRREPCPEITHLPSPVLTALKLVNRTGVVSRCVVNDEDEQDNELGVNEKIMHKKVAREVVFLRRPRLESDLDRDRQRRKLHEADGE